MKRVVILIVMLLSINLYAVPGFIVHQGYIEDSNGNPISGVITMRVGIYGSPDGDDILFEQEMTVAVSDGYYVTEIDDGAIMPVFNVDKTLYLEITINGKKGTPRQKIGAVPYAFYAAKAYDVIGDIHPNSIYINGTKVIDETGKYTGPIDAVKSITAGDGLAGGTITSTGTVSLLPGYLDGSVYDNRFVNENQSASISTDMIKDGSITGQKIANGSIGLSHIHNNGCTDGQIMKYNASTGWGCATDLNNSYLAGNGILLTGNTFSANFAGTGNANTVARSDHNHNGIYSPISHNHDGSYAPISHNHDGTYVKTKGDTMTGKLDIIINNEIDTPIALTTTNGSILFAGPDGITPTRGAGIRLMWVPSKSALRVGEALSAEWDDANLGKHSYAFGRGILLKGSNSFATGNFIQSEGDNNITLGNDNILISSGNVIIGHNNEIIKNSTAYVFGSHNIADTNSNNTYTFGEYNTVTNSSQNTYAIGEYIVFDNASKSFGIGSNINITASNSVTIGKGDDSLIGGPLINTIDNSFMVGFNSMKPTLFVGPASGYSTTGNVGIGVTNPNSKLEIDGGVRTIPTQQSPHNITSGGTTTNILEKPTIPCTENNRGEMRLFEVIPMLGAPIDTLCVCMRNTSNNKPYWHCFR